MKRILKSSEVYKKTNLDFLNIKNTSELKEKSMKIISQEKAKKSLEFGLSIDKYGYNIFCSGKTSSRKNAYLKEELSKMAKNKQNLVDLCYIYNFENPSSPILLSLPSGKATQLKDDMKEVLEIIEVKVKNIFTSERYAKIIDKINGKYEDKNREIYLEYEDKVKKQGFAFVEVDDELISIPVVNGKIIEKEEDANNLSEKERKNILSKKVKVNKIVSEMSRALFSLEEKKEEEIKNIDKDVILGEISKKLNFVKKNYTQYDEKISSYINKLTQDILAEIGSYKENKENTQSVNVLNLYTQEPRKDNSLKFFINVLVDNKNRKQAPVVFMDAINEKSLFGTTTFDMNGNIFETDFSKVKAGSLLLANGGYLVINTEDLLMNFNLWQKLKRVIKRGKTIIPTRAYRDIIMSNSLTLSGIPINVKIILTGNIDLYYLLYYHDLEFKDLFKIHAIFDDDTNRTMKMEEDYVYFIKNYTEKENLKPVTKEALEFIIEYSSRLASNQNKLVLSFSQVYRLLDESNVWAEIDNKKMIDTDSVEKTLRENAYRNSNLNETYEEYIRKNIVKIDTSGKKIGEVNGLSVSNYGDISKGKPVKITANTYVGDDGVISVDRNVKLTGKIHNKGIDIIIGYLGKTFASEKKISLSANVVFEQNYGQIEGDSATCAEVCAILSDMSNYPINQSIAITGSMNQKGEVQAVGGVNEKIEGFFEVCKIKGLTREQGVIIPSSNIEDLMLSKEVRTAIEDKQFTIYAIDNIRDAVEILIDENADFINGSIHMRIKSLNKTDSSS